MKAHSKTLLKAEALGPDSSKPFWHEEFLPSEWQLLSQVSKERIGLLFCGEIKLILFKNKVHKEFFPCPKVMHI